MFGPQWDLRFDVIITQSLTVKPTTAAYRCGLCATAKMTAETTATSRAVVSVGLKKKQTTDTDISADKKLYINYSKK